MKKQITALLLAGVMVMFAACAGGQTSDAEPAATPEAMNTPAPTAVPVEIPEGRLFVTIERESGQYFSDDGAETILYYDCDTPVVSGTNAHAINPVLRELREEFMTAEGGEGNLISVADFEAAARRDRAWRVQDGLETIPYEIRRNVSVARGDETVISFLYDEYFYTGGAHGSTVRTGLTFRSDGSRLSFADLSPDPEALRDLCVEQMIQQSRGAEYAQYSFHYDYPLLLPQLVDDDGWYLSDAGLVIVANPYDIAPYAFGCIEFTISYETLNGLVHDWLLPGESTADGTLWGALGSDSDPEPAALVDHGTDGQGKAIRFTADGQVRNVRLQQVRYNEYTGGFDVRGLIWYATSLQSGEVLRLLTEIPDTMPNLKISYQGKNGREQAWYISQSGLDGALILLDGADFTTLPRQITDELPFRYDLDNDGAMEMVDVESYLSDEMGGTALRIAVTESDGSVQTADTIAYWNHAVWLVDGNGDGRAEIYFSGDIASDDYMLCGWHYDGTELSPIRFRDENGQEDWLLGQIAAVDSGRRFTIVSTRYILGTYSAKRGFVMDADGVIAPVEGSGWEFDRNQFWLELSCDLTATVEEQEQVLPAGSHILLTGTDGESWVEFLCEDYTTGRLSLSRGTDGWRVDGVSEWDAFAVLPYAG